MNFELGTCLPTGRIKNNVAATFRSPSWRSKDRRYGLSWARGATAFLTTFLILNSLFLIPKNAHAQISNDLQDGIRGLGEQTAIAGLGELAGSDIDIRVYVLRLVRGALGFVGLALIFFILYGGFLYMTSQGNEEKLGVAKKVITQAAIGTAIIMSSYGVTLFITRQLTRAIASQMGTQVQSCGVSGGVSTCCTEWNAYQSELSSVPALTQSDNDIADQYREGTESTRVAYNHWHDCFERASDSIRTGW
ncbi:MAG: hypothetical protein Q7S48_02125 [bacterium]|nr:hypothetical protein [bacterium]